MKKIIFSGIASLIIVLTVVTISVIAYGYNFSLPAAHRYASDTGYSMNHQAYDYRFTNGTKVAAIQSGTVIESFFERPDGWKWPCDQTWNTRGKHIIMTHTVDLTSSYFHLSINGNTPGVGTNFSQGEYMALSDNTGCSSNPHLHFATKLNGVPFDPYEGATDWVSG